jgi:pimeloyl-ACP methyl ester carboxylesterase
MIARPDGATIAYDVVGDGPSIVFLHGITNRRQAWDPITGLLVAEATCVRVDLRGHGESSLADDYSAATMADDVEAVISDVGLGPAVVVGHSLGGAVAGLHAAAFAPRATVCVDQSLRFGDNAAALQPLADVLRGPDTLRAVLEFERHLIGEDDPRFAELEQRLPGFPREVVLGVWDSLLNTPPDELTALAEAILPAISSPLLSLHGSPPPPDYAVWLSGLVPSATVEIWPGAGHMLHLADPARFVDRLRMFVASSG